MNQFLENVVTVVKLCKDMGSEQTALLKYRDGFREVKYCSERFNFDKKFVYSYVGM